MTARSSSCDDGPSRSDDLADHVSYADVVAKLKERAKSTRHTNLVETLAEEVAVCVPVAPAAAWMTSSPEEAMIVVDDFTS